MDRFEYASNKLDVHFGEKTLSTINTVRLYDGDTKTSFQGGDIVLTSHRLLWFFPYDKSRCLSLELSYVIKCEVEQPGMFAFKTSFKIVLHLSAIVSGKSPGPVQTSSHHFIKLSFKDRLHLQSLLPTLKDALLNEKWKYQETSDGDVQKIIKTRTGIVGIERGIEDKQRQMDQNITVAFKDLEKLMAKAQEMVTLSMAISEKIRAKEGNISEDETVQLKSYLLGMGIQSNPVTRDMSTNEAHYFDMLGKEIYEIIQEPLVTTGIMSLTEAYCRVNRARGFELVSPEDLYVALKKHLKGSSVSALREYDSGVKFLVYSSYSLNEIIKKVKDRGSLTAHDLAQECGISILLAQEQLLHSERCADVCRDETVEGVRFYPNLLVDKNERKSVAFSN